MHVPNIVKPMLGLVKHNKVMAIASGVGLGIATGRGVWDGTKGAADSGKPNPLGMAESAGMTAAAMTALSVGMSALTHEPKLGSLLVKNAVGYSALATAGVCAFTGASYLTNRARS